jgi:predicted kinase
MTTRPLLLLISGHPASGKTTLAQQLAPLLHLPLLSKDVIKEALYDTLGWSDHPWAHQFGAASGAVLFAMIERQLAFDTTHPDAATLATLLAAIRTWRERPLNASGSEPMRIPA